MARDSITVGMPISLSGRYALQGRQCCAGLQCYAGDLNRAGGLLFPARGRRLSLKITVYDDRSDEATAQALTERLINEGVDLLFGPYGSGLTAVAAAVAERHQCVLWNHSGAAAVGPSPWVVGVLTPAEQYFGTLLDLLHTRQPPPRRVVLFHADTGFAAAVAGGVHAWAREKAIPVATEVYPSGTSPARVRALLESPADVVLGVGRIEDDLMLARALRAGRTTGRLVGVVAAGIARFREELGDEADGFLAPTQWEPAVHYQQDYGPSAEEFLRSYGASTAVPLDYPAAQAYAAGLVAQRCIEEAGSLEPGALRAAAARCRMLTFYGAFAIDPASGRQTAHRMLVVQWQHGRKRIVWPAEVAEAEVTYT